MLRAVLNNAVTIVKIHNALFFVIPKIYRKVSFYNLQKKVSNLCYINLNIIKCNFVKKDNIFTLTTFTRYP